MTRGARMLYTDIHSAKLRWTVVNPIPARHEAAPGMKSEDCILFMTQRLFKGQARLTSQPDQKGVRLFDWHHMHAAC